MLENISKKSNSSSPMSVPSDWLARPVEGPDWSLILRTDKNGYKIPGCSSWAPSLQKQRCKKQPLQPQPQHKLQPEQHQQQQKILIKSSPRLSVYPDPHLHSSRERERGKGGRKKKKTQQLSGNFSENAPKLSSASGAGDQCFCNP